MGSKYYNPHRRPPFLTLIHNAEKTLIPIASSRCRHNDMYLFFRSFNYPTLGWGILILWDHFIICPWREPRRGLLKLLWVYFKIGTYPYILNMSIKEKVGVEFLVKIICQFFPSRKFLWLPKSFVLVLIHQNVIVAERFLWKPYYFILIKSSL